MSMPACDVTVTHVIVSLCARSVSVMGASRGAHPARSIQHRSSLCERKRQQLAQDYFMLFTGR